MSAAELGAPTTKVVQRLVGVAEDNPIYIACAREIGGARLAVTGPFAEEDLGVAHCHSKVGAAELLLNHMVDWPGEYVVVDMTAGADFFASGLFTRFDLTALVCEPTSRSVGVYRQYLGYAKDFGIRIAVIGNKVCDADDLAFCASRSARTCCAGSAAQGMCSRPNVARYDRSPSFEPDNQHTLATIHKTDRTSRGELTKKFTRRNRRRPSLSHL